MTEIIRVAERCARKNQTNLDSDSTQISLKKKKTPSDRKWFETGQT